MWKESLYWTQNKLPLTHHLVCWYFRHYHHENKSSIPTNLPLTLLHRCCPNSMLKSSSVHFYLLDWNWTWISENLYQKYQLNTLIRHYPKLRMKNKLWFCKSWLKRMSLTEKWIGLKRFLRTYQQMVRISSNPYQSIWEHQCKQLKSSWR